jgi:hypothetical protein
LQGSGAYLEIGERGQRLQVIHGPLIIASV